MIVAGHQQIRHRWPGEMGRVRMGDNWCVFELRTGRIVSRHQTEQHAWAEVDRLARREVALLNRGSMAGGGYGHVERGVGYRPTSPARPSGEG